MKPVVKESEKSRILMTKDFSLFEFPDVKISKKHLEFVRESLVEKNLMPDYPILVDDRYRILDGKYKFLACYELKLPIFYKVSEVTTIQDAMRVKEISRHASLSEIFLVYKDIEPYANVQYIRSFFNDKFSIKEVLLCIDGAIKERGQYHSTTSVVRVDRYKLISGRLPSYDVNTVIKRLTSVLYIMEEFQWDALSAITLLVDNSFTVNYEQNSKMMRKAKRLSDINGWDILSMYAILQEMPENKHDGYIAEEERYYKNDLNHNP